MPYKELLKQAESYFNKGDWGMASQAFGEVISLLEEVEDDRLLAVAHQRKGYADLRRARYESSIRNFTEALNISTAIDDINLAAEVLRGLGYVHWQTGTYELSAEYFQEALLRASEIEDMALLGKVKIEYGNLMNFRGELDKAIEVYDEAIQHLKETSDPIEESRAHNNKGDALFRKEMHKEAIEEFKIAIKMGEDNDHLSRVAWARSNAALSMIEIGQTSLAKDYIVLAKDYMERIGDRVGVGDTYEAMGLLHLAEGKFDEAENELRLGLGVATELDVPDRKAIAERNLGRLYKEMGRGNQARHHLSRAVQQFKDIGMKLEAEKAKAMLEALTEQD